MTVLEWIECDQSSRRYPGIARGASRRCWSFCPTAHSCRSAAQAAAHTSGSHWRSRSVHRGWLHFATGARRGGKQPTHQSGSQKDQDGSSELVSSVRPSLTRCAPWLEGGLDQALVWRCPTLVLYP